jgi:biopolymer transport protein ExbB
MEIAMEYMAEAYEYFCQGGFVMALLAATSLWMWGMIVERLFYFRRVERNDLGGGEAVNIVLEGRPVESSPGILGRLLKQFQEGRTGDSLLDRRIMEEYAMRERPRIRRFLPAIAILAATAPLFGLLGTVTGMIATFDVISVFGTGNAKALAGGISKALVTTQGGLLVGIPGLFMSVLLTRKAGAVERRLEETLIALKRAV